MTFLESTSSVMEGWLQCFGGGACNVLDGHGILEEALAVVLEGVAFLEGASSVMEGACSVLEEWLAVF